MRIAGVERQAGSRLLRSIIGSAGPLVVVAERQSLCAAEAGGGAVRLVGQLRLRTVREGADIIGQAVAA